MSVVQKKKDVFGKIVATVNDPFAVPTVQKLNFQGGLSFESTVL